MTKPIEVVIEQMLTSETGQILQGTEAVLSVKDIDDIVLKLYWCDDGWHLWTNHRLRVTQQADNAAFVRMGKYGEDLT